MNDTVGYLLNHFNIFISCQYYKVCELIQVHLGEFQPFTHQSAGYHSHHPLWKIQTHQAQLPQALQVPEMIKSLSPKGGVMQIISFSIPGLGALKKNTKIASTTNSSLEKDKAM